ncbi:MAG: ArsR/SmtB family transcription factor [Candidatus Thorarchaeota archaeon]|nr:MAG: hypothetical protein DRP09_08020 [Candidatus Thorarchaeota archaeon]RLI58852.1 MAG: hypothetical protein DRO87_04660 [Candidatus Thorarchaeota archaeon]
MAERLKTVDSLVDEEICQCEIFPQTGLFQSTVSAYLNQLVRAGILTVRRDGTRKLYRVGDRRIRRMIQDICSMAAEKTCR